MLASALAVFALWPSSGNVAVAASPSDDAEYVVVKAGRVITVTGEEIENGMIVIEDGKISLVGSDLDYPPSAKVISARHETVMPGFVHARSRHGLPTYDRTGIHGDQTVASEIHLSQMDFDDLLRAGFTTVCFIPAGEGIPGLAAAFRAAGPDDSRTLTDSAYLHVTSDWGPNDKKTLRDALKKAKEEIEKVEKARKEWEEKQKAAKEKKEKEEKEEEEKPEEDENGNDNGDDGKTRRRQPGDNDNENGDDEEKPKNGERKEEPEEEEFKPPPIDPKYQPLVDLIGHKKGSQMMVQLTKASDLHHLDDVLEPYDDLAYVLYLATSPSTDYHHVVESLGERQAKTVIRPWIHFLPETTFRYNLVQKLAAAGCDVSVIPQEHNRVEYLRLRSRLAELVRAGLSREDAIKTLTLHPATAIGLGERLGTIEKAKDADLVFLSGDPLDPHTVVQRVMILGKIVWTADDK